MSRYSHYVVHHQLRPMFQIPMFQLWPVWPVFQFWPVWPVFQLSPVCDWCFSYDNCDWCYRLWPMWQLLHLWSVWPVLVVTSVTGFFNYNQCFSCDQCDWHFCLTDIISREITNITKSRLNTQGGALVSCDRAGRLTHCLGSSGIFGGVRLNININISILTWMIYFLKISPIWLWWLKIIVWLNVAVDIWYAK